MMLFEMTQEARSSAILFIAVMTIGIGTMVTMFKLMGKTRFDVGNGEHENVDPYENEKEEDE